MIKPLIVVKMINVLEIGSGKDYYKGEENEKVIHLDISKKEHVEVVHDLERFPWPFKDNSFDKVYASHILEHLSDLVKTMEEIYRICKNDTVVVVKVPFFASAYAFRDPTHKRFFTYDTFDYFVGGSGLSCNSKARFEVIKRKFRFSWNKWRNWPSFFINLFPVFYQRYLAFIFPCNEIYFELRVEK